MNKVCPEIEKAETLPSSFYTSDETYAQSIEKIFARSWQYVGDKTQLLKAPENVFPITLLEKSIDEPLIIETSKDEVSCMSNVCTHRGFQIVHHPSKMKKIICGYHGRSFDLEGKVEHMPEFKEAIGFPRACDHLTNLPIYHWKRFLFTGVDPKIDFSIIKTKLDERLGFLDIDTWRFAPEYSKVYNVSANWALYCDNYLEGFHIPFVHQELNSTL